MGGWSGSCSPLAGAWWRGQEGVDVCWLTTSWTRRLHLGLNFRNLQDLTELLKIHYLMEEINEILITNQIKKNNKREQEKIDFKGEPFLCWSADRPHLQSVASLQSETRAYSLWAHLDWNWRQMGAGGDRESEKKYISKPGSLCFLQQYN